MRSCLHEGACDLEDRNRHEEYSRATRSERGEFRMAVGLRELRRSGAIRVYHTDVNIILPHAPQGSIPPEAVTGRPISSAAISAFFA